MITRAEHTFCDGRDGMRRHAQRREHHPHKRGGATARRCDGIREGFRACARARLILCTHVFKRNAVEPSLIRERRAGESRNGATALPSHAVATVAQVFPLISRR